MPLLMFLSVHPFHLALHFRFHCTLANLALSLRNHSSYPVTDNLDVRFRKSVVYSVPIFSLPERMLQAILAVRTINDHIVCMTPHDASEVRHVELVCSSYWSSAVTSPAGDLQKSGRLHRDMRVSPGSNAS